MPVKYEQLLNENPQATTIVMEYVEGSVDDEANLEAARLVRLNKLNTLVPGDGLIASGGTDFFLAGLKRTIKEGAQIGVHSWAGFGIDDASKLPRTDPEHQEHLQYYKEMGIPADFYWYTLEAAPSDDIHWMTQEEIKRYKVATP
ncbi:COG3904 family protein [Endozoicomonas numazuensis]|uniref:COG3904 family protein n=1 Tax=Endozoicomonas numazuensis TaxID=1137799 RepID=UPI001267A2F0|nr:alpha/beta hydrolase [Endozoicomonas numazuensis]